MKSELVLRILGHAYFRILIILGGFCALGTMLGAVRNARALVTPGITHIATLVILLGWMTSEIVLRSRLSQRAVEAPQIDRLPTKTRFTILGFIILLWVPRFWPEDLPTVATGTESTARVGPDHPEDTRISVLVAEFAGCSPAEYGVAQIIEEKVQKALTSNTDVRIERLETVIMSRESARSIAISRSAPIIVWGSCFANKERARVTAHFEILQDFRHSAFLYQDETINDDIARLQHFTIQDRLSTDMSFLVLLTLGLMRLDAGDYDGAVTRLDQALTETQEPVSQGAVLCYRGICYLNKHEFQKAASDFVKAARVEPYAFQSLHDLGVAYVNLGRYPEAIRAYSKSLDFRTTKRRTISLYWDLPTIDSDVPTYHARGHAYYMTGDYEKALTDFIEDTKTHPNDPRGYFFQALAYAKLKQPEEVIHSCSVALEKDPNHDGAYHIRGHAYMELRDMRHAIDDFTQATTIRPGFAQCYFDRALAHKMAGDSVAAMFDFYESIKGSDLPDLRESAWQYLNHQNSHHRFEFMAPDRGFQSSKSPVFYF